MSSTYFLRSSLSLLLACSSLAPALSLAAPAPDNLCNLRVPGYAITRLTNTPNAQEGNVISLGQGKAVWMELPRNGGAEGKVIYLDQSGRRTLSERAGQLQASAPDKIVWTESSQVNNRRRSDIFFFNGREVVRITPANGSEVGNYSPTIDPSGKIAWLRLVTEGWVQGASQQVPSEYQIMLYDGVTTRAVSASGNYAAPKFFGEKLGWIGVDNAQRHQDGRQDRRSVFFWTNGVLQSHQLADATSNEDQPSLTAGGAFYGSLIDADNRQLRYYNFGNDTTVDVSRYRYSFDPNTFAKDNLIGWQSGSSDASSYFWNGREVRELHQLLPERRLYLRDINTDKTQALYRGEVIRVNRQLNGSPTINAQIFTYNIATNALTQFTDAPAPDLSGRSTGASDAWYGKDGEIYWSVFTQNEEGFSTNDVCRAVPVAAASVTLPSAVGTPTTSSPAPVSSLNPSEPFTVNDVEGLTCSEAIAQIREQGHFDLLPTWKRITVSAGRFSVEMPHNSGWTRNGLPLLPYTPYPANTRVSPLTGAALPSGGAIHFGRYSFDLCSETLPAMSIDTLRNTRDYILTWETNNLRTILRRPTFAETPLTFKLGNDQVAIVKEFYPNHSCVEDIPQEVLYVQKGNRVFALGSLCKPVSFDHFRMAMSLR